MSDPDDVPTGRAPAADDGVAVVLPGRLRKRIISQFGIRATHAVEDGLTLGILFALTFVSPVVLSILSLAIFGERVVGPTRLLKRADALVRTDDIAAQPLYFIVAFAVGAGGTTVLGVVLMGSEIIPLVA